MKKIYILLTMFMWGMLLLAQPNAEFEADDRTPNLSQSVRFTNLSTGATGYKWTFSPNTITYVDGDQNAPNPKVKFNQAVKYTVQLLATDGFEEDTEVKFEYIIISPFQIGINEDDASGYINIQVRVNDGDLPSATKLINDIEFGIMWDKSIISGNKIDLDLACADVNPYHLEQKGNPVPHNSGGDGGWDYRNFGIINGTGDFAPPEVWEYGEWMTVVQLQVYRRTPGGDPLPMGVFHIVPNKDHFNKAEDPILEIDGIENFLDTLPDFDPMGASELPIPTNLHGYRWVGGRGSDGFDDYSWNHGPNWNNGCGGESSPAAIPPGIYDDCIIPNVDTDIGGSGCYPRYTRQTDPTELVAVGQDISVVDGGRIEWMRGMNSTERVLMQTQGYLKIAATSNVSIYSDGLLEVGGDSIGWIAPLKILGDTGLRVKSGGWLDTKYTTSIEGDSALIIEADANGVGSFINHGEITYSNGGTAKVETFVTGEVGDYYMHFVGPTVEDTVTGYNKSVRLQQFDMTTLDTYAFEWNSTVDTTIDQPWVNVWPFDYEVPLGNGLTLSNYEAGEGTIQMVGKINYQPITYYAQSFSDNHLELISNPYSSAIDFEVFQSANDALLQDKYYIYNASTGNWITWAGVTGDQQYLQVGQGFFVVVESAGNIVFDTSMRVHNSTDAFRELIINRLSLNVTGGEHGFSDKLHISFLQEATNGYDPDLDAKKWNSYSTGATMIRSIAEDGTELAINSLDEEFLYLDNIVSVPVHFQCGYEGTYTFEFSEIESFESGTEIWMEDRQLKISNGHKVEHMFITPESNTYIFTASPGDDRDRFVIHFSGPSYLPVSIDENSNQEKLKIYSFRNSIYILNVENEEIKEAVVYNMLGQEILRSNAASQEINQFELNAPTGYYAVRVLTDQNVYSEKVFIKAN